MDIRSFTVRYEVFGNFRRFRNAVASFGPSPENNEMDNNQMDVSVDLFDNIRTLKTFKHVKYSSELWEQVHTNIHLVIIRPFRDVEVFAGLIHGSWTPHSCGIVQRSFLLSVKFTVGFINLNQLNSLLDATYSLVNTSWFRLIAPGPVRLISNRTLTDQLYKRQQRGGRRLIPFDNIFLGMIILCKNVVGHLSTYIGGLDDMDAMEVVDGIFNCACSILQTAIGFYLFSLPRLGQGRVAAWAQGWSFYLSTQTY